MDILSGHILERVLQAAIQRDVRTAQYYFLAVIDRYV